MSMESSPFEPGQPPIDRVMQVARQMLRQMSAGFAQANQGERGLRAQAYNQLQLDAGRTPTAYEIAPDYVPEDL